MLIEGLNKASKEIYEANKLKGFDVAESNIGQTLMLIVSEVAEAMEADRKSKHADIRRCLFNCESQQVHGDLLTFKDSFEISIKDTFEDEIADIAIRLFDLCGAFKIDIEKHIDLKLKYNSLREYKHGGKKY